MRPTNHRSDDIVHRIASTPMLDAKDRHRLLETGRRRTTLSILGTRNGELSLLDLARDIVEAEGGSDSDEEAIQRVASLLHHVDLPILGAANLVDYDASARRIEPHSVPSDVAGPR